MVPVAWMRFALLAVLAAALTPPGSPAGEPAGPRPVAPVVLPLTSFDVVAMVHRGVSDDAIIRQLRETKSTFRLTAEDTQMLRSLGVSAAVLKAMAAFEPTPVEQAPAPRPAAPNTLAQFQASPFPFRVELQARVAESPRPDSPAPGRGPAGSWVREVGPVRVGLKFAAGRVTVTARMPSPENDGEAVTVTAEADYSVSAEGLLYGVVTGIDADEPNAAAEAQLVIGHAFSARCRMGGDTLTVRDVKFLGSGLAKDDEVGSFALFAGGRYARDDGSKPAPMKKPSPSNRIPPLGLRPVPGDAVLPPPVQRMIGPDGFERLGVDFNAPPPQPVPPPIPARPTQPALTPAGAVLPGPGPAGPVGTWYREVGPMMVVLKVGPDHLTVKLLTAARTDDGPVTLGLMVAGEYALSRDGSTMHGLITGVDAVRDGDVPPDADQTGVMESLQKFQALADQPFALGVRVQDGELLVRRVRVAGAESKELRESFDMLAGRYKSAGDKPPKPKPARPQTSAGAVTLPSPRYLEHPPQYIAPVEAAPQQPYTQPLPTASSTPPPQPATLPPPAGYPVAPQYYPVSPVVGTLPLQQAPVASVAPDNRPVGTWVRERDGVQVVLKFTERRLFATLNLAYVEPGKKAETRLTFRADADYAVSPDGMVFGVVTGIDLTPPAGDTDLEMMPAKMLAELNGMPFCFRFRVDDGALSIRELRFADSKETPELMPFLGRYGSTDGKDPAPPKPGKGPSGRASYSATTPPTPHYLQHGPEYVPPDPPFPLKRESESLEQAPAPRRVPEVAPMPRPVVVPPPDTIPPELR